MPTATRRWGNELQEFHCPLPPGREAVYCRSSTAHCPQAVAPGHYTHHVRCPHFIQTLQRVVDKVSLPMSTPGQCPGTTPILVRGPSLP